MKTNLLTFTLVVVALLSGCSRDHVDSRILTSYSIVSKSEADRDVIVDDFEEFLGQSGLENTPVESGDTAGLKSEGESTELWRSASAPYAITITENPEPVYLTGDISWDFRGAKADWPILRSEIQEFQRSVVDWFKMRPDVNHKDSTYWDGSMNP